MFDFGIDSQKGCTLARLRQLTSTVFSESGTEIEEDWPMMPRSQNIGVHLSATS